MKCCSGLPSADRRWYNTSTVRSSSTKTNNVGQDKCTLRKHGVDVCVSSLTGNAPVTVCRFAPIECQVSPVPTDTLYRRAKAVSTATELRIIHTVCEATVATRQPFGGKHNEVLQTVFLAQQGRHPTRPLG